MKTVEDFFKKKKYKNFDEFLDLYIDNPMAYDLKNLFEEYGQYKVNELNKSDVIKSVCEHCGGNNDVKNGMCWDCHEIYDRKG